MGRLCTIRRGQARSQHSGSLSRPFLRQVETQTVNIAVKVLRRRAPEQINRNSSLLLKLAGLMDEHWMPMSEMCSVCSPEIEYDFIIKFENLAEEERYFIQVTEPGILQCIVQ